MTHTRIDTAGHWKLEGETRIARIGFGAMRLPARGWDGPAGERDSALAVLRRAVELGVDHIDTAAFYFYEDLAANELIRAALRPYPEHLVIATKVGPRRGPEGWLPTAGPKELRADVEQNLRELGRDSLDLVYLRVGHIGPSTESIAERFAVLAAMREEGLIRHLGLSNVSKAQLAEARALAPVAAVQNHFHLLRQREDADMLAECEREGIAYAPFFPLGGFGLPDDGRIRRVADRHGVTVAKVMLAWLLARSPVTLAIPGTSSPAHLAENVAAAELRLTPEDMDELAVVRAPEEEN
ncbi:oxidoreductase [Streptosporangium carneum]|uniref:Oxidoreductase n=1 Tax=Streptosporangium carneum TaxID=47481 RepID=A0A9W6HY29_9ACTN|nr:oxidoreductase [Streptosporangium carneum]GLK07504.1 oxidoreductase [Streptosporangium carneum]